MKVQDIIAVIENYAPPALQESWDNTGLQVGHRDAEVKGVLTCVDVTPERIDEAVAKGVDMIVSHHPLLFKPVKSITGANNVQCALEKAIRNNVAVYSSHTSTDSTVGGVSAVMAQVLGARVERPLDNSDSLTGLGVVAELPETMTPGQFIELAKKSFCNAMVRTSDPAVAPRQIRRVAMCGGAGDDLIEAAISAGAQAYVTGELRYHHFLEFANRILLIDCGHYETEQSTKFIFKEIINKKYPSLKVDVSETEVNPVKYY